MTQLRKLVEELNCSMFVVSHLKRPEGKGHEEVFTSFFITSKR